MQTAGRRIKRPDGRTLSERERENQGVLVDRSTLDAIDSYAKRLTGTRFLLLLLINILDPVSTRVPR